MTTQEQTVMVVLSNTTIIRHACEKRLRTQHVQGVVSCVNLHDYVVWHAH
jgi:hypothetical protein